MGIYRRGRRKFQLIGLLANWLEVGFTIVRLNVSRVSLNPLKATAVPNGRRSIEAY